LGRKKNRHYRWELTLRVENKQPRHCPELIIEPRKGSDLLATVIEVLVKLRCQEELTSICTGWSRHDEVGKVDFYVTRETIGPLWTAIKAAKTQRISTVYLLPDQIQASALVDLRPAKEPVTSADPSSTGFSAAEQQQLSEILRWIAKWRAAGLQSMTSNLGVTSTVASRLLAASCERGLTEAVSFKQEDQLYRLTGEGARLAGMDGNPGLRIVRRTLDYFSRRARVAAILASRSDDYEGWAYEVVNPSDLGDDGPVVEVDCGGAMRPSHADILMKPCIGGLRRAIAVVLVTDYQWPCESLCEAWYSSKSVERVVFYAISAVLADLEEIIATAGMADKLKVVPMPLSDHAQGERERAIDEQLSCQRRERFERRREAQRQSWAKRCPEFSELTDQEWTALDPILAPGGPSSPRLWCGVAIDADRDVVDTILLAQKLGRDVRDMKATDGYAAGPSCLRRIDEWQRAGVWTTAWRMLAEIAPARGLPAELNAVRKVSRTIEPRGLFTDPSYSRILRGDLRLWEAAYLSGTG
jgi:transposase